MLESGYVILPRSFFRDWEWSDDANTVAVFFRLIIEADIAPNTWHEIEVPRGGMVSSYAKLAEKTGLSVKQVRTAIKHLDMAGYVARTTYAKCTVFTVKNFDLFQAGASIGANSGQGEGKQEAGKGQQNKKIKEDKEDNNLSFLDAAREKIAPTFEEIQTYAEENGILTDLQRFFDYYEKRGWKTKNNDPITDWKSTLRYWAKRDGKYKKNGSKKKQQDIPVSENAEAYASLIYNLDEPYIKNPCCGEKQQGV